MKKFFAGFIMHSAMISLYQDIVGKENYIAAMKHLWITPWITVPLALLAIIVAVALFEWDDL